MHGARIRCRRSWGKVRLPDFACDITSVISPVHRRLDVLGVMGKDKPWLARWHSKSPTSTARLPFSVSVAAEPAHADQVAARRTGLTVCTFAASHSRLAQVSTEGSLNAVD